jgi:3-oxoacyl-(acyl-carrier-protein) synthase
VIYAIATSRLAVKLAGWERGSRFGVNLGSSRGATETFEHYHGEFLESGKVGSHASPGTTLGNIASWVAQDLGTRGPEISHSITCSTALHAVLNGVAWIRAGLEDRFLAGGSEAPLTPFTIAQMRALKIYSRESGEYPSRALDLEKTNNSMVLGEGAGVACLEKGVKPGALALISGLGYATEDLTSAVSLSREADCLQRAMSMALAGCDPGDVDALVLHAPGTLRGDRAEYRAVQRVFGQRLPALTTNKWKLGHTLGASGLLSLELAVLMLQHQSFVAVPFVQGIRPPGRLRKILVNAVGFGGNAVSLLVERPPRGAGAPVAG